MTATHPWIGVVLAGGRSSRMGQDKALLPWRGRPLVAHMQALLRDAGALDVVISGDRPGYAGIADAQPDLGPLGGLASVIDHVADATTLVVVPVDMPLLSGHCWSDCWRHHRSAAPLSKTRCCRCVCAWMALCVRRSRC